MYGLMQHMMETVGHNAPSISNVLIPLRPYADDLIIISTTAAGLQRQLDVLQQFCHERQLSANLSKTKVVTFGSEATCQAFMCNGNKVEQVESHKYLGIEFHATQKFLNLAQHVLQHVSAAKKAMHSMKCTCTLLPISDSELLCKPFESLVPFVLSSASEVFGVDKK